MSPTCRRPTPTLSPFLERHAKIGDRPADCRAPPKNVCGTSLSRVLRQHVRLVPVLRARTRTNRLSTAWSILQIDDGPKKGDHASGASTRERLSTKALSSQYHNEAFYQILLLLKELLKSYLKKTTPQHFVTKLRFTICTR